MSNTYPTIKLQKHQFTLLVPLHIYFRDILEKIAQKNNLVITDVIQRPIDNLLAYHKDNIN